MKARKVILLLVVCVMLLMTAACSAGGAENQASAGDGETEAAENATVSAEEAKEETEKEAVRTTIGEFEYACQTSDVDAMLGCLNPGFSQSLQTGRLLLNWMSTDKNSDEAIMNTMLISLMHISDITVDPTTIHVEIMDIELKEGLAMINATLMMNCSTGEYKDEVTFRMHMESDNKWYIAGVTT